MMVQVAQIFMNGRSQAVRLPAAFRFHGKEVFIRQDPATGDVILSKKPLTWDSFLSVLQHTDVPENFLDQHERMQIDPNRDPFEGWRE